MTPAALAELVRSVAHGVLTDRGLDPAALPDTVAVHRPRDPQHGDYATNVALQTQTMSGVTPRDFAGWLAQELAQRPGVRTAQVAEPGFVNLWLGVGAHVDLLTRVLATGKRFGAGRDLAGHRINVQFVSVDPTGRPHLGDARQQAVGDALARILSFEGAVVTRHFNGADTADCDICIQLLGADHDATGRLKTAAASDDDPVTVEVLSGAQVNLVPADVRLTERESTLADLVEVVGMGAARYALIRGPYASPIDIDVNVWAKKTDDNPVFSVQYAHARSASLARNAADLGISSTHAPLAWLDHHTEGELIRTLGEFPNVVGSAAALREPHRVARHLEQLAAAYYRFTGSRRVLPAGDERPGPVHAARLALCEATRLVLANGLGLLGVSAPERM